MMFVRPMPFKQAVKAAQGRSFLPTSGASKDLQRLDADVRERAFFTAKGRSAEHLGTIHDGVADLVAGKVDVATARLRVTQYLRSTGYLPEDGKAGSLEDFGSRARIDLQLQMNVQQAQGYGYWKQGQDPDLLDAFPARAFVRVEDRETPRDNWGERWDTAREQTTTDGATESSSGEMVALANHPIWAALSRFGTPYEPFDYGSGMGQEDRSRSEAMTLGLIGRDTQIFPQDRPFNESLQSTPQVRAAELRALLEESGAGRFGADGVFHFIGGDS